MYDKGSLLCVIGLCILAQIAVADNPNSGSDDGAQCLENCLTVLQQRAPRLDAASVLSIGHIRSGNETVMCPRYDSQIMNSSCGPYRDAAECFEKCPEGQLKRLSTSGFAPLKLVCIDRTDDFERYMPCLSDNCVSAETMCQRECGSFDDLSRDILQLLRQIRGPALPDQSTNAPIDPANFTMIIDKACASIRCYAGCSRDSTTSKCGEAAYNLEMETIWTIFASMTQSMSSIGLSTPWPESCTVLADAYSAGSTNASTAPTAEKPSPDEDNEQTTTRSNSVDQFIQKNRTRVSDESANGNATATPKCDGKVCGSAPEMLASAFTLAFCTFMAIVILK